MCGIKPGITACAGLYQGCIISRVDNVGCSVVIIDNIGCIKIAGKKNFGGRSLYLFQ